MSQEQENGTAPHPNTPIQTAEVQPIDSLSSVRPGIDEQLIRQTANTESLSNPPVREYVSSELTLAIQTLTNSMESLTQQIKRCQQQQRLFSVPFKVRKARQNGICCICHDSIDKGKNIIKLNCQCRYDQHIKCITTWLRVNHNCPLCRKKFRVGPASFLRN